ncbi:MAG: TRAP transporter substrate-binding protein DctP [Desulfohalobiaceae bacterium]|nr:TRAP transporter substrate-binding protein DctP [Desulfohalobiaceae bacterium]
MKKMRCAAVVTAAVVFLVISTLSGTAVAKEWKSGHPAAPDSVANLTHERFIDLVAEKTDGEIVIDGYPAEQLGPYRDMFDNVVRGIQEMGFLPVSPEFSPSLQAVYTVYLADDWEQGKKIYAPDGWMFKLVEPIFADLGVKLLGFYFIGMDGLGSTKGPVVMPKDLVKQDIKVRVWCPADRLLFQEIGAQAVDIAFSELFTSLQTGVAHAQDNTPEVTYTMLRDVTDYYTDIGHIFEPFAVIINKDLFEGLDPEIQTAIQEAANEALAWGNKKSEESEEEYYAKMEEAGITVTRLTPEQREAWKEYGRASWEEFEEVIGKDMMDYIRDHAE